MTGSTYTAFEGQRRLAAGELAVVATAVEAAVLGAAGQLLIFDDATGDQVELDLRNGPAAALQQYASRTAPPAEVRSGRGRPKLGVIAREVTLLPRHWDWLATQPGGASAAIRRLVEGARRAAQVSGPQAVAATHKVMTALAGNAPHYEDALRALYAGDGPRFETIVLTWPNDVSRYVLRLAAAALA